MPISIMPFCIASTTVAVRRSSHTWANRLPTMVIGMVMKVTPTIMQKSVTSCPPVVAGTTSPLATVGRART